MVAIVSAAKGGTPALRRAMRLLSARSHRAWSRDRQLPWRAARRGEAVLDKAAVLRCMEPRCEGVRQVKRNGQQLLKRAATVLAMALGLGAANAALAAAGYVNNAEQWSRLAPAERAAYVQGVNDTSNFVYLNDDLATGIIKAARTRCLIQTKMAPNLLSDVITTAYDKTPQLRSQPPMVVYLSRLNEICRPVINEERARFGLPPM
jgi:hypothetical protein